MNSLAILVSIKRDFLVLGFGAAFRSALYLLVPKYESASNKSLSNEYNHVFYPMYFTECCHPNMLGDPKMFRLYTT